MSAGCLVCCRLSAQTIPAVFLHTDRAAYFPGDTVWFKSYILKEGLLDKSVRNLYIDWGNPEGAIMEHNVYLLVDGMSACQFVIPGDYSEHVLNLNAYTSAIASHRALSYFKSIPVLQKIVPQEKNSVNKYALSIYPESGVFLKGMDNRFVLRSYDRNGQPISVKGRVVDAKGKELLTFSSDGLGLAEINLPGIEENRTVIWYSSDGQEFRDQIPPVQDQGVKFSIQEFRDTVEVSILSTDVKQTYTVDCRLNGRQLFKQNFVVGSGGPGNFKLPKQDLEAGVLQFQLLGKDGKRVGQRALMIGDEDLVIRPEVEVIERSGKPKGRNSFRVRLPKGEEGNLSVSVTDPDLPVDSTHTIVDAALFGSLSANRLVTPYAYFKNSTVLDRFVETNAWHTDFSAVDALSPTTDSLLYLKGRILMKDVSLAQMNQQLKVLRDKKIKKGQAVRGSSFGYRSLSDSIMRYQEVFPDEKGRFSLTKLSFFDSLEVRFTQIEQAIKFRRFNMEYSFAPVAKPDRLYIPVPQDGISPSNPFLNKTWNYNPKYYKNEQGIITLREVNIQKKRNYRLEKMDRFYAKGWYTKSGILSIDVQNDTNLVDIYTIRDYLDYLYRKYPVLNKIRPVTVVNGYYSRLEQPALPADLSQIAYVKVFESFPQNPDGGAIAFYTTGPDGANRNLGQVINIQTIGGYVGIKTFWNRMYRMEESDGEYDDRLSLYWNPLLTVKDSSDVLEFCNNSKPKGYWLTIQGVTNSGKLVYYQKLIK